MPAEMGAPPSSFVPSGADSLPLEIGVLIAGWHTGIVLPASELGPLVPLLRNDPGARYVSFGWGNRRFYMSSHPGPEDAIAALFRSPSTVLVQPAAAPSGPTASDIHIHWLCADRGQVWRMDHYIEQSLVRPGHPVDIGPGPFPDSRFYASTEHYSVVHTCNTWTAAALEYAHLPISATGVLFSGQVDGRVSDLRACRAAQ
ncbi:MAG: DUF2459 domain-containing protein [Proteobacteria bacterium]|nr:DUF2459 domain-containing protein [Pseudomonadota bacterium]